MANEGDVFLFPGQRPPNHQGSCDPVTCWFQVDGVNNWRLQEYLCPLEAAASFLFFHGTTPSFPVWSSLASLLESSHLPQALVS